MKYDVMLSCGHEVRVNIFGSAADRERKIKYLEEYGICLDCRREMAQERFEELPPADSSCDGMDGTEKQKRFASALIRDMNEQFDRIIEECKTVMPDRVDMWIGCKDTYNKILCESDAGDVIELLKNINSGTHQEYYRTLLSRVKGGQNPICAKILKKLLENK